MRRKKSKTASLENKRGLLLQVSMIIALSVLILAFEWKSYDSGPDGLGKLNGPDIEPVMIPITRQEEIKKPIPPPKKKVIEELLIVDDEELDIEEIYIEDVEPDQNTMIEIPLDEEPEVEEDRIFTPVEANVEFPGGEAALLRFIAQNTNYPQICIDNNIEGKVFVDFVVDKKGCVTNAKIKRGVDQALDAEALRVVNSLLDFIPGKQREKPVKVTMTVTINFKLE